jgi:hypothetical protein
LVTSPAANPKRLTAVANRLILAPDERSFRVDLVRVDRAFDQIRDRLTTPLSPQKGAPRRRAVDVVRDEFRRPADEFLPS